MKRLLDATHDESILPVEVWCLLVDRSNDRRVASSVFLLNKAIHRYLRQESQYVMDFLSVARLNRRHAGGMWFICEGCDELRIYESPLSESFSYCRDKYCGKCMIACPDCGRYNRSGNYHCRCGRRFITQI